MKYISYGVDGSWYEWTDFKDMLEYYKGHPKDRWTWFIEKKNK
tara:strand:+ start:291 stop:419 length:129 start_codon:yes stop_codon:yes gene_type:complete